MSTTVAPHPTRAPAPWVWMLLNLPFGATSGYVAVTLGFIAKQQGLDDEVVGGLVAASLFPHTWKFLFAPLADLTLSRKTWYIIANLCSCVTLGSVGFVSLKTDLSLANALLVLNSVFIAFLGMAVEGLMAHTTPPDQLGRAAGWFQAGNLGGGGVGGGLALIVAENSSGELASIFISVLLGLCTLGLLFVQTPHEPREKSVGAAMRGIGKDLWGVFGSRLGIVAIALCLLPLGAGAAANFFSAIGEKPYGASPELIALVQGVLGGVVSAAGCLVGGWLSDRMTRRNAYALAGLILGAISALMALSPATPVTYALYCLAYNLGSGVCYGAFTGFVLEVIGKGAAATKYNALAALSNIPILYMTLVLGTVSTDSGTTTMLWVDAASGMIGAVAIFALAWALRVGATKTAHVDVASDAHVPSR